VNFGWLGVFIFPAAVAYLYQSLHERMKAAPHFTIRRLAYLMLLVALVQVYRDGIVSLIFFPINYLAPFTAVVIINWAGWRGEVLLGRLKSRGASTMETRNGGLGRTS